MYWRFSHLFLTDDINFCFLPNVYNSCPYHHYNRPFTHFFYSFIHFIYLFIYLFILFIYLFIYTFIYLFIYSFILFIYLFIYLFFYAEKFHHTLARLESQHAQFMGRSGKPLSSSKNKAQHQYKYMTPDVLKHFFGKVEILKFRNFEMFIYCYSIFCFK